MLSFYILCLLIYIILVNFFYFFKSGDVHMHTPYFCRTKQGGTHFCFADYKIKKTLFIKESLFYLYLFYILV